MPEWYPPWCLMDIGRQPQASHRCFPPLHHAKEICLLCLQTWAHPTRASVCTPKYTSLLSLLKVKIILCLQNRPTAPRVSALSPPDVHHLCSLFLLPNTYREGPQFLYIHLLRFRLDGQVMTVRKLQLPHPSSSSPLSLASRQLSTSPVPLVLESLWLLLRSLHSIFVTNLFWLLLWHPTRWGNLLVARVQSPLSLTNVGDNSNRDSQ